VIADQGRARSRHQRGQLPDEVDRVEVHSDRAVTPDPLEAVAYAAIREQLEPLARDRRPCDVPAQPFQLRTVAGRYAHIGVQRKPINIRAATLRDAHALDVASPTRSPQRPPRALPEHAHSLHRSRDARQQH
jgi:hypothetical protein